MKINLTKQMGMLVPHSQEDKEKLDAIADGAIYEVNITNFDMRTLQQNKALHKYFTLLANELNNGGLTITKTLKVDIEWSPNAVKELLWRPIQMAVLNKKSTTKMNKDEVTKIYDTLNRALAMKFGFSVEFPNREEL